MPKKLFRLLAAFCILFNSLNLSAFALESSPAPQEFPPQSPSEQAAQPLPSAPQAAQQAAIEQPPQSASAEAATAPAQSEEQKQQTPAAPTQEEEKSSVSAMAQEGRFKLFEPEKYDFMRQDGPLMPLPDRQDGDDEDEYYRYTRKYLENTIAQMQGGVELQERGIEYLEILNPSLLLPIYGTTISLTGRKTFGIKYSSKKYKTKGTINNRDESGIEFDQEMQMKVQGKISDRIFVDIDYDDQREDAQNISVSYRGKQDEIVQSADFGDINLSLPGTEFVSYNKQVFGAKMHLKYGGANLRLIGSQSKGENKTKQFKGDSQQQTVNLKDISYIKRRYYDLTFGANPTWTYAIASGSEKVYIDDHTNTGYQEALKVQDLNVQTSVYPDTGATAGFRLLTRGVDYVVDYNRNIIRFVKSLGESDIVAIDYTNSNGQKLSDAAYGGMPKIIKTASDRPVADPNEIGYKLEVKRFYDIGATQITKDDGQGNFILKLLESDGREVCPSTNPPDYCKFTVDYTRGIFEIAGILNDPAVYNPTPISSTNRYFLVQYNSTVKTYFLEPDIVVQSETVKINGATMGRNKDYYVDYASGYITFYNENLLGSGSVIDVTYQVSSGPSKDSALLGGRFNYDFTDKISIGSTILNEGGSKPKRVPKVGDLATNLTTTEADIRAKDLEIMDGVKLSLGAEAAQSKKDQNLFGYALVDNMDETKEYVKASPVYSDWRIASNPTAGTSFFDSVKWDSQSVPLLEINPNAAAGKNDYQNVLVINYDFTKIPASYLSSNDEVSLVFPISSSGTDFTNKTLMELSMMGELNGPEMNISFGTFDERSDNYNYLPTGFAEEDVFPTCSKYYGSPASRNVPKTEDLTCRGGITSSQDIGWLFVNPDGSYQRYNPFVNNIYNKEKQPNGRIDNQDLNDNGILDSDDGTSGGNFGFAATDPHSSGAIITDPAQTGLEDNIINYSGWKQFRRDVNFVDPANPTRWTSVKQMRITLKRRAGGSEKGTIKIANLSVSGNTWKPVDDNYKKVVSPYGINNIDNPDYKPIFNDNGDGGMVFRTLYGSVNELRTSSSQNNVQEQSLALKYDFTKDSTINDINVQRAFSAMDFSQHKQFRFLFYNNGNIDADTKFYIRLESDSNNYSEVEIPLDSKNAWHLYSLKLIDTDGDNIPNRWENASSYDATVDNLGSVNFKRISSVKVGLRTTNPAAQGEVWLDDIFLAESVVSVGNAYMGEAKVDVDNWFEVSGKVKYMDDKFQTPVTAATNQKFTEQNYALKIKRIKDLPVTATYYKSNITTPDVLNSANNTISVLDQGEVTKDKGTVKAEYIGAAMPRIAAEYVFENADYQKLKRSDNKQTYSVNMDYNAPLQNSFVKTLNANTALKNSKINYSDQVILQNAASYYDTDEQTQSYGFKLALQPWEGASLVPSYSLAMVDEERHAYNASILAFNSKKYSKSANQQVGVTGAFRINKWLAPTASYTIRTNETNNLSPLTYSTYQGSSKVTYDFDIGEVKSIDRSAEGNVALNLNGKEIFSNSKLLAGFTLSGAYKMQDGDTWANVKDSYNSLDEIWIRNSLGVKAPYTYRSNLTLRDTYTASMRWVPFREYGFDGRLSPLKKITISNNFSKAYQTNEDTGSMYKTETTTLPDLVLNMDEMEKFVSDSNDYFTNVSTKLKYSFVSSDIVGTKEKDTTAYGGDLRFMLLNYFDTTFTYTEQKLSQTDSIAHAPLEDYLRRDFSGQTSFMYGRLRFTPKVNYIYDIKTERENVLTSRVEEIVPSLNLRADFNLPYGIKIPFITRQYLMTNRIIWNSNVSFSRRRSFTVSENRDLFTASTSVDYEISKNIRLTLSAGFEKFKHIYLPEESYTAYNAGTLLTIQF